MERPHDARRPTMNRLLVRVTTRFLVALLLSATLSPVLVESTGHQHAPLTSATNQQGHRRVSGIETRSASVRQRFLQNNKQDKDDDKDKDPTEMPVTTPLALAPAPLMVPPSLAPVVRFGSSWGDTPLASPVMFSPNDGGDEASASQNWSFSLTTNPPVNGNLLIVQLEEYLIGANIEYVNGEFNVTSPREMVTEHQAAIQNVTALQSHMQQTLGNAFLIDSTKVMTEDTRIRDSSMKAGASAPTTVTDQKFPKKDIILLSFFGIFMAFIISGIAGVFLWKKREISDNEKGGSQVWAYDKEKEERLAVVETLSSAANEE